MLKTNELQIGDWVQNPLGYKAQVLDIHYIKDEGDGYGGGYRINIGDSNWGGLSSGLRKRTFSLSLSPQRYWGKIILKLRSGGLMGQTSIAYEFMLVRMLGIFIIRAE